MRVARGEQATRQRQDAATDAAYAAADDLGANFTSITQLPPAIQRDLPPATIDALTRQAGQHAVPRPVAENGDAVAGLNLQLSRDPAAFAQQDLRLVRDLMTPREYATLSALQSQLRTDPAAPPVVAQRRILATIARDGPVLGIDLASPNPAIRQRAQALAAAMATDIAAETASKRLPTDEEIARSFQRQADLVVKADPHTVEDVKSLSDEQFAAIHAFAKALGLDEAQENQAIHEFVHRKPVGGGSSKGSGSDISVEHSAAPKDTGFDLGAFASQPSPTVMALVRGSTLNRDYTDGYRDYISSEELQKNAIGTFVSNPPLPTLKIQGLKDYNALVERLTGGPVSSLAATGAVAAGHDPAVQQRVADLAAPLDELVMARVALGSGRASAEPRYPARGSSLNVESQDGILARRPKSPVAKAIDQNAIREIERGVRAGETIVPLNAGSQLRAVANLFANKVQIQLKAGNLERAEQIRAAGLNALYRLDRFKVLTPEEMKQLDRVIRTAK